jgi:taurine dioxygenase
VDRSAARAAAATMAANGFGVRRLSGAIGAEISGIDLDAEPGHNVIAEIRQVWLDHGVIFFRDQDMPPAKFLSFAKRFGEVVEYPFIKGIEGFAEIIPVIKLEHEKHNFGGIWHSDTPFANMYLAYETLPDGMKCVLNGMIAINSSAKADGSRTREDRVRDSAKPEAKQE